MNEAKIIYTLTDEAPALATWSLLPIVQAFAASAAVRVETRDISLAGRILANFPEDLAPAQRQSDDLAELGKLATTPEANIIKLPNISASLPQLQGAIEELQNQGYKIPTYPEAPANEAQQQVRKHYAKVLGSAVNPVLREGNSDRRVAKAVKQYARKHPHSMGKWSPDSKTRVAHMSQGDFFGNEQSAVIANAGNLRIEFVDGAGKTTLLKDAVAVRTDEIIGTTFMSVKALRDFYAQAIGQAKAEGLLLSLHLKATMMKVSDPILFGHAVSVYFAALFAKNSEHFDRLGINPDNGFAALLDKLQSLPSATRVGIEADIAAVYAARPPLAMVDSDKGITNLHVSSDVIIDASMPAAIRASGQMWGPDGKPHDTLAMIPDRCYAGIYQVVIDDCRTLGAYDVSTMGNVSNIGLMAQAAEEYGSHDKTFQMADAGTVRVVDAGGATLTQHQVSKGDIWRMCQTRDVAIVDWVKLAVNRARATGQPAIFWLDSQRAYDRNLIARTRQCLEKLDTSGLDIRILSPVEATRATLLRVRAGQDTISVTGNVLRDYLTDLFPILEL
ncbi:MAG: NADP-dependent isocitrate dehydrogenase, partial [Pseudomonadota bacterium]